MPDKPEKIIEKMVQGRINKFYEEVCLLEQIYVKDGETRVGKMIENRAPGTKIVADRAPEAWHGLRIEVGRADGGNDPAIAPPSPRFRSISSIRSTRPAGSRLR